MLIPSPRRFLTGPIEDGSRSYTAIWLGLSLITASLFIIRGVGPAFRDQKLIQDDARQHVFWMQRFSDPAIFPGDPIADYFQTVAPAGYTTLYRIAAALGIGPITFSKFLPALLGIAVTFYCFALCTKMFPVPMAGFLSTLILNLCLWTRDDLISATPRAFIYPLLLAWLYYLARRSLLPLLMASALLGLFYPAGAILASAILPLSLLRPKAKRFALSRASRDYILCASAFAVLLLVLAAYALKTGGYGPVITSEQARAMAEFRSGGRTSFFDKAPWDYWVTARLSGILPGELPALLWAGLLLPLLLLFRRWLSLSKRITGAAIILPQILIASFALFFAAHALLFRLYLPSRYTMHSLLIVMSLAAAIGLTLLLDACFELADHLGGLPLQARALSAWGATLLFIYLVVTGVTSYMNPPRQRYRMDKHPEIYSFLAAQPKDALIASLADAADNIPVFSGRSVLVSREYAISFHPAYYAQIRERALDLLKAHYSPDLSLLQDFIRKYRVAFFLVERSAFTAEYLKESRFTRQFLPQEQEALATLEQGERPALLRVLDQCAVLEAGDFIVLKADCITEMKTE